MMISPPSLYLLELKGALCKFVADAVTVVALTLFTFNIAILLR